MGTPALHRPRPSTPPGFAATLALSMGAGPLALYALTATAPLVTADLDISRAQLGALPTAAFVTAALASPLLGRSADLFHGRTVLTALFTGAGLSLFGVATAPSYGWLFAAVALCGATQAMSNPVTNRLVAAHVPQGRRGRLMGVKQSGVQMSQFAAGLALPGLALVWGWRGAAASAAVVAATGLALVRGSVPAGRPEPVAARERRIADLPAAVWWLTGYALTTGAALQATNVYLPLYGFERLELSPPVAGLTAAVAGGVGLVARIAWGRAADLVRRPYGLLLALAVVSGFAACCLLAAEALHAVWLLWAGAALFGASGIAANVVIMLALMRAAPPHAVGIASGILAVGLYLGFAAGPLGFGLIVDHTGSYRTAWLAVIGANALAAALGAARLPRGRSRPAAVPEP
ncbi:MFS transporter [Streptomyces microflavus]|uniref:MFS transporter n=1 Tax=Streptomyces microflavus TaxID=1919 RepID=UPI0029BBEEAA|nr:MFS transporter [Streptomyces microflavus]MDX2406769.1 MFS transporter [Streptomyces microflavus]